MGPRRYLGEARKQGVGTKGQRSPDRPFVEEAGAEEEHIRTEQNYKAHWKC